MADEKHARDSHEHLQKLEEERPIASAIDRLIHRASDTKPAARSCMPIAQRMVRKQYQDVRDKFA